MREKHKEHLKEIADKANKKGKNRWGIEKFEEFIEDHPEYKDDEWVLYKLGSMYDHLALEEGENREKLEQKALDLYDRILEDDSESVKGLWGKGRVYWHRGDRKALEYAKKAYEIHKENTGKEDFANEVALVYKKLGNYDKAEEWFQKFIDDIEDEQKKGPYYANLLQFYQEKEDKEKIKNYRKKLESWLEDKPEEFKKGKWGKRIREVIEKTENFED